MISDNTGVYASPEISEGAPMADIDEAFAALKQLDEDGRKALSVACMMWEEKWREATARAEKAEWLLGRLHEWAAGWGLIFDVSKAAAHWDAQHDGQPSLLTTWFEAHVQATGKELQGLRTRLDDALDGREQAEIRAEQAERALAGVTSSCAGRAPTSAGGGRSVARCRETSPQPASDAPAATRDSRMLVHTWIDVGPRPGGPCVLGEVCARGGITRSQSSGQR